MMKAKRIQVLMPPEKVSVNLIPHVLRKQFSLFVLFALPLISCDKEEKTPVNENPPKSDPIVFVKLPKDTECYSVRSYTMSMNQFCDKLPLPNDSTAFIELDIDKDTKVDFRISVKHFQIFPTDYCGHCHVHYHRSVAIQPLTPDGFISSGGYKIRIYDSTELIKKDHIWSNAVVYASLKDCPHDNFSFNNSFWGLKLNNRLAWLRVKRVSDYGFSIRAFAYNLLNNSPIAAGQEK